MSRGELDPACLARARRGDPQAFRALYEHHAERVYRFLARMLGHVSAEDALQETFLRVLRALRAFDPAGPAALGTWILTIARRVALARERSRERSARREQLSEEVRPRLVPPDDAGELRRALEAAVAALPLEQRAVFVLREWHGLSYQEIAVVEAVDLGTVKSRLYRARLHLQAALRDRLSQQPEEENRERHVRP